jgi:glyoxylase I family protein
MPKDQTLQRQESATLAQLPLRMHHHAFVVRDQEANRHFFEDILDIPLAATWCERSFNKDVQREIDFCHTFFAMADGSALAFFQFADDDMYQLCMAERPAKIGFYDHIALKVDLATYAALMARLKVSDIAFREINHGYCKSIYATSPDGLVVEFTADPPDAAEIDAERRADAHAELARWLAGDRRSNNSLRHREF